MTAFQVKTQYLKTQKEELGKAAGELSSLAGEINAVRAALSFRGEYRANIVSNLGKIAENCTDSGRKMRAMGDALGQTIAKYEKTETKIVERLSSPLKWTDYTIDGKTLFVGENGAVMGSMGSGIGEMHIAIGGATGYTNKSDSATAAWYRDGKFNPYAEAKAHAEAVWKYGEIEAEYKDIKAEGSGRVGYASADAYSEIHITENGIPTGEAKASAESGVAKGNIKMEGKYGKAELTGAFLAADAHAGISLLQKYDNDHFTFIKAEAAAKAAVLSGKIVEQLGTDQYNVHRETSGALLGAEALASVEVGSDGVRGEAGCEAYIAKGKIKSGFTLCGIQVDASMQGTAGGVGAKAKFGVTETSLALGAGLSALFGTNVEVSIDWSKYKLPDFDWDSLWEKGA